MLPSLTRAALALGALLALAGCGTAPTGFSPVPYVVAPNRSYRPVSTRTITICPAFDRMDAENRMQLDPQFNPPAYLTGIVELELTAAGLKHDRAAFTYAPDFPGIQKALQSGGLLDPNAVVLSAAINHFSNNRTLSCDFKVYSSRGDLLLEKRCLCLNYRSGNPNVLRAEQGLNFLTGPGAADPGYAGENSLVAPRMVMQQLLADPDFQKAIQ